jgi:hypothetical protein
MRPVKLIVGAKPIGFALTWAYPDGGGHGVFTIPTYEMTASGKDAAGKTVSYRFEVIRFGILCKAGNSPRVVGLADFQTHTIKAWLPNYSVHSARSVERGAWQVHGNFLIHDGPDHPKTDVYASIGCIEVCGSPRGFDTFNDCLIGLAAPSAKDRSAQLAEMGASRQLEITYLQAKRPPLTRP